MERLLSLLVYQESEVTSDGQTDTTRHSSEGQSLSAPSSSGDSTSQVINLDCGDLNRRPSTGSSLCFYQGSTASVLKTSFIDDYELESLAKRSHISEQSDFHWTTNVHDIQFTYSIPIENTRQRTDILSSVYSISGGQESNIITTTTLTAKDTYVHNFISSEFSRLISTAGSINTEQAEFFSQISPSYVNHVSSLELTRQQPGNSNSAIEESFVRSTTLGSHEISNSTADYDTGLDVVLSSDNFLGQVISNHFQELDADNTDYSTEPTHLSFPSTEHVVEGRTVQYDISLQESLTYSKHFTQVPVDISTYSHLILASYAQASTERDSQKFWYGQGVTTYTSLKLSNVTNVHSLYESSTSSIRTTTLLREVYDRTIVPIREVYDGTTVPTSEVYDINSVHIVNQEKSAPPIPVSKSTLTSDAYLITFTGFDNAANILTLDTAHSSQVSVELLPMPYSCVSHYTDTVSCSASSVYLETVSSNLVVNIENEVRQPEEWLHLSQFWDVRTSTILGLSSTRKYFVTPSRDSLNLVVSHDTITRKSKLTDHATLFISSEDNGLFMFTRGMISATDDETRTFSQTSLNRHQNGTVKEELNIVDKSENIATDISESVVSIQPVLLSVSAPVTEFFPHTQSLGSVTQSNQLFDGSIHLNSINMENTDILSTYLQPSSAMSYDSVIYSSTLKMNNAANAEVIEFGQPLLETSTHKSLWSQSLTSSSTIPQDDKVDETITKTIYSSQTIDVTQTVLRGSEMCSGISCPSSRLTNRVYESVTMKTIPGTSDTSGGASSKQMPNFNTTIIIASACAVLALVVMVIIAIVCLRRKKRTKSTSSGLEGDDMWVDLYRENSSHQMPLPSLTTCTSTFEMNSVMKPGSAQDLTEDRERRVSSACVPQVCQVKPQRHVTSFQIKKPKGETKQDPGFTCPVFELEAPDGMNQAEHWVNMTTSGSMTSLPTTDISYNTNVTDYMLAAVGHKFQAVYAYKPVCKGEMALKEGELVICKEKDRNGWMYGTKPRTNEEGWFPAVYVDEISSDFELDFNTDVPETYDILESNKLHNLDQYWTGIEHRVCYSYESSVPGDLHVEPGQTVTVLQTLANGWWFAIDEKRCGWFPGSYVEMITDNSILEQSSKSDYPLNKSCISTESQQIIENDIAAQTTENEAHTEHRSVTDNSELTACEEKNYENEAGIKETVSTPEPSKVSLTMSSITEHEMSGKNDNVEPKTSSDTKSKETLTPHRRAPDRPDIVQPVSTPTNPVSSNSSLTRKSAQNDNKLGKSLRPARPAPPPPKRKNSKVRKDSVPGTEVNKAQTAVAKKTILLIKGKRPKLQKVLRSQLDEKQLNPMIKPSTRGFIPKPSVHRENRFKSPTHYNKQQHEYNTSEHDLSNSSTSIADDFHSELMILLNQHHETSISPSHTLNFRTIAQNKGRSSSKSSLESDLRLENPGSRASHRLNRRDNFPNTEHSKPILNNVSRERSLTPDYRKEKSNSPILLTTGNLLQNVQRFHGSLSPSPSPSDTEPIPHNMPSSSRRQRMATTVTPPKVPSINNSSLSSQQDHSLNQRSQNMKFESFNKQNLEVTSPVAFPSAQPNNIDINSNREDIPDSKRRPSTFFKPDKTTLNKDSLVVTPGTVSEIVYQINNQSPIQEELIKKLKSDKTDV